MSYLLTEIAMEMLGWKFYDIEGVPRPIDFESAQSLNDNGEGENLETILNMPLYGADTVKAEADSSCNVQYNMPYSSELLGESFGGDGIQPKIVSVDSLAGADPQAPQVLSFPFSEGAINELQLKSSLRETNSNENSNDAASTSFQHTKKSDSAKQDTSGDYLDFRPGVRTIYSGGVPIGIYNPPPQTPTQTITNDANASNVRDTAELTKKTARKSISAFVRRDIKSQLKRKLGSLKTERTTDFPQLATPQNLYGFFDAEDTSQPANSVSTASEHFDIEPNSASNDGTVNLDECNKFATEIPMQLENEIDNVTVNLTRHKTQFYQSLPNDFKQPQQTYRKVIDSFLTEELDKLRNEVKNLHELRQKAECRAYDSFRKTYPKYLIFSDELKTCVDK